MRKIICFLLLSTLMITSYSAFAILNMELTRGVLGAIPIAMVPFTAQGDTAPQDVSRIITDDLQHSGRFKVYDSRVLSEFPSSVQEVSVRYFRRLGTDNVVIGKVSAIGSNRYQVSFQLLDIYQGEHPEVVLSKKYTLFAHELRAFAHHISDLIYEQLTGIRGIFSTRLAYVVVQRKETGHARYLLEVADQDGYSPRPLLDSPEPIMSPAWSPNGKQLAYVSFEKRRSGIYIQDVTTGARRLLSEFPGVNGAPAWSPDGRKLALVLSKGGSPNIYIMDIATQSLTPITRDFYINTEPAWSPDGQSLLFTSTRSGGPQVYQINLRTGSTTRLSYDGDYNARPSFSKDGKSVVMIHRVSGMYSIAILDLDNGTLRVISNARADSSSPSIAPNSSMILFDTVDGGRNVLGMVSADGRVQLRLPARNGEAQDPAWSPFLP